MEEALPSANSEDSLTQRSLAARPGKREEEGKEGEREKRGHEGRQAKREAKGRRAQRVRVMIAITTMIMIWTMMVFYFFFPVLSPLFHLLPFVLQDLDADAALRCCSVFMSVSTAVSSSLTRRQLLAPSACLTDVPIREMSV